MLSATRVREILTGSLFEDGESRENAVIVEGITKTFGFNPAKLEGFKDEILEFLMDLPETFRESEGGGWSFLNACMDKSGRQWGEHINMEELFVLGMAIKRVKYLLPRKMWVVFPGSVPYLMITDQEITD